MVLFVIAIIIFGVALAAVGWVLIADPKTSPQEGGPRPERTSPTGLSTSQILNQMEDFQESPTHPWFDFFIKRILSKKDPQPDDPVVVQEMDPSPTFSPEAALDTTNTEDAKGTAALRMDRDNDPDDLGLTAQNQSLMEQVTALREKNQRVEDLLSEKNAELTQLQAQLAAEQKNRKEFNKVKDILDKELKDSKDRNRDLQSELANTQAEAEAYLRRLGQLEEKAQAEQQADGEKGASLQQAEAEISQGMAQVTLMEEQLRRSEDLIAEKDRRIAELVGLLKGAPEQLAAGEGAAAAVLPDTVLDLAPAAVEPSTTDLAEGASADHDDGLAVDSAQGDPLLVSESDKGGGDLGKSGMLSPELDVHRIAADLSKPGPSAVAGEEERVISVNALDANPEGLVGDSPAHNAGDGVAKDNALPVPPPSPEQGPPSEMPTDDVERMRLAAEQLGLSGEEVSDARETPDSSPEDAEAGDPAITPPAGEFPRPADSLVSPVDLTPKDLLEKIESGLGQEPRRDPAGPPSTSETHAAVTGTERKNPFSDFKNLIHFPGREEEPEEPAHLRPDVIGATGGESVVPEEGPARDRVDPEDSNGEDVPPNKENDNPDEKKEST